MNVNRLPVPAEQYHHQYYPSPAALFSRNTIISRKKEGQRRWLGIVVSKSVQKGTKRRQKWEEIAFVVLYVPNPKMDYSLEEIVLRKSI